MSSWFCADFETTSLKNLEKDGCVRVWLWSLVGVEENEKYYGTSIETFIKTVRKLKCKRIFFHNLKFDGRFIVDYFSKSKMLYGIEYECVIDGLNNWYEIKWHTDVKHTTRIWDSAKKFPGTSVEQLGKWIGMHKLEKPYFDRYYPKDYTPTQEEIDYCIRDSEVIAKAISYDLEQGFKKMTLAGDCFQWGRENCLNGRFYRDFFPELPITVDEFIRKSYKGGISYLKPEYEDKEIHNIKVFDVNSLYPWVMHDCPLPVGYGSIVEDKPKDGLYVVKFTAEFYVKSKRFPFLQMKNTPRYMNNEFIEYSNGYEELTMTSVDYENFKKNYKILDELNHTYMKFDSKIGLLAPHIDHWMYKKKEYEAQGLPFMRYVAKTMMNSFYGKTGTRTERQNVIPILENDKISYSKKIVNKCDPIYVPYATFVTSWARDKLINSALKVWNDFVYCDTDSIHCFDSDNIPLDIHPTDLGKWKDETANGAYEYARYIKQKTYCHARPDVMLGWQNSQQTGEEYKPFKEVVEIRAAGLNVKSRTGIAFEDFKYGLTIPKANLKMHTVSGGAILLPTDWSLDPPAEDIVSKYLKKLEV